MFLTEEEKKILDGEFGETLQKVMKTVVLYGQTFGAKRLVKLDGPVHLVTSFGIPMLTPVFEMMEELIKSNIKAREPFTVDPRPLDYRNVPVSIAKKLIFKVMYGKQKEYEVQLKAVGLKDDNAFTCACYLPEVGNIPKKGDILAWAESSAVVYANSVIGARTNRNSGIIELMSGILGKTPEFGFITDEGRKATWLVEVKTSNLPNPQVLGSAIGMKVVEDVPYIIGLDKFLGLGLSDDTKDYLKDMGAASASNGAVGLYHVENITPEAVEMGRNLLVDGYKSYIIDDEEIKRVINSYPVMWKNINAKPKLCFIGCPHLSINQLYFWTERIIKALENIGQKKLKITTILCAPPDVIDAFKRDEKTYNKLIQTGAKITYICPLMYMNNPLCANEAVITNSNKLRTYSTARFYLDDEILERIVRGY
ncbi:MAG: aconitase X catalytic domain-containing protein [Caloramator sp.]|nr:aconitase X catalytic domain-containing protein [Caloramator sp.]